MDNDQLDKALDQLKGKGDVDAPIKIYVASAFNNEQSILLGWEEDGNDILDTWVDALGTPWAEEYGLDNPPGRGIWVFEGKICMKWSLINHPEDPPETEADLCFEGEWRSPSNEEMKQWRGHKAKHITTDEPKPKAVPWDSLPKSPAPDAVVVARPVVGRSRSEDFCVCGKHVSECCCGEDHSVPHHPSGRAYYDEEWEQFEK